MYVAKALVEFLRPEKAAKPPAYTKPPPTPLKNRTASTVASVWQKMESKSKRIKIIRPVRTMLNKEFRPILNVVIKPPTAAPKILIEEIHPIIDLGNS